MTTLKFIVDAFSSGFRSSSLHPHGSDEVGPIAVLGYIAATRVVDNFLPIGRMMARERYVPVLPRVNTHYRRWQ